jgi:hypothetical protein
MDINTILDTLQTSFNWLATNHPDETLLFIMAATSPLLVPIIKLFNTQNNDTKRVIALVGAMLLMSLNYLLKDPTVPPQFIVAQGVLLHTFNQPYYKLIIKPFMNKVQRSWNEAINLNNKKAAVLPPALAPTAAEFSE